MGLYLFLMSLAVLANPTSKIRPATDFEAEIVAEGVCRSPTLRMMVETVLRLAT